MLRSNEICSNEKNLNNIKVNDTNSNEINTNERLIETNCNEKILNDWFLE